MSTYPDRSRLSDTAALLEMRAASRRGDSQRVRDIEADLGMVEYAPGRYISRSVLGTRGYEAETRGAREFEHRADLEQERALEQAIEHYKSILGETR